MSIRKISAAVGAMATAAACMVLATPVVSAAPTLSPECGLCWGGPKAASVSAADIAAFVGSGVATVRL